MERLEDGGEARAVAVGPELVACSDDAGNWLHSRTSLRLAPDHPLLLQTVSVSEGLVKRGTDATSTEITVGAMKEIKYSQAR